ncbi:MAG: MFS transporter [Alphaproteobacteria bacterium]|jgi:MFS family permease
MTPDSLSPRDLRRSLGAVYACIFANGLGMGLSLPLFSLLLERNGVSATLIGANVMTGAVAMIIVTPFIPALAARFGTVRFLVACYAIAAACLIGFRAADSLLLWFVFRFVLNAALQGLFVASEVWINQIAPERMRGRLIAIYTAIFSAGFALGPGIIQLLGTQGWAPFIAGSVTMMAALIPLVVVARRLVPVIEHAKAGAMFGFVFSSPSAAGAALCYGAVEACAGAFLAIYAVRQGIAETQSTLLIGALGLGNMLLVPFIGWLADKTDRRHVLIGCGIACIAAAACLPMIRAIGPWELGIVLLWGGVISAIYAVGLAHLGARFRGGELAAANSAFAIIYATGTMVGPSLGGLAMDLWNPHGLVVVLALIPAVFVMVTAWRAATFRTPAGS